MNIRIEHGDELTVLHCEGSLVLGHETDLLCAVMRQDSREVIVDVRGVTAVDAAGVGALISLQAAGFYLTIADANPVVREVLARTGLDTVFEIVETGRLSTVPNPALDSMQCR